MRVIECNTCGEPLTGADDDELLRRLRSHMEAEHSDATLDEQQTREQIGREAYTAADN
jgi:predicted small metal-binding protein